jgi:hypothetical protein
MKSSTAYYAKRLAPCLILIGGLALGCTSETSGPGDASIVDLDSKSDTVLLIELSKVDIFRINCDLERCLFDIMLIGASAEQPLYVATGGLEELQAHRDDVLAGRGLPIMTGLDVQNPEVLDYVGAEDTVANVTVDVARGEYYGMAYVASPSATDPSLGIRIRLVPDIAGASPLPQEGVGEYSVSSVISADVHRWTVSVADVLSFFEEEVSIRLGGDATLLDMVVYYQCMGDGTTTEVMQAPAGPLLQDAVFTPDCPSYDDSGAVYIEVTGTPSYMADYTLSASLL